MSAKRSLYSDIREDIEKAILEVLARHDAAIKKRKESKDRLMFHVCKAANKAGAKYAYGR